MLNTFIMRLPCQRSRQGFLQHHVRRLQEFRPCQAQVEAQYLYRICRPQRRIHRIQLKFFSLASGIVCALVFHLVCTLVYDFPLYSMAWSVCSLTVVFIIRFYLAKRDENSLFDILAIFFIIVLVVSFEGAVIFTILEASADYADDSQVRFMYTLLRSFKIPVFLSALLPRFPVNLVDKAICVPLGFLCYKGLDRIFRWKNAAA